MYNTKEIYFRSKNGTSTKNFRLKNLFGNVDILGQENMIDNLAQGLVNQNVEKIDNNFADDVSTTFIFDL